MTSQALSPSTFILGITSMALRGVVLISKFILMVVLAAYLSTEELGVFALSMVTITLALYFVGMDFYLFSAREILSRPEQAHTRMIRDQFVFHLVVYLGGLPLLALVFIAGVIPWVYAPWIFVLLVLEHFSQELYRLLITLSRPIQASLVLFFRGGAWVYAVLALFLALEQARDLSLLFAGWVAGVACSIGLAAFFLRKMDWKAAFGSSVDWRWIRSGLKSSTVFLAATLALQTVLFADRYFVEAYLGQAAVGVYALFASFASVIQTFVVTGVISILYPKIVSAFQAGEYEEYRRLMRKMAIGAAVACSVLVALAAMMIDPILTVIGKPVFKESVGVFWFMLAASVVLVLSWLPHYALYVRKKDWFILYCSIAALGAMVACNVVLIPMFGLVGAATSQLIAAAVLLVGKSLFLSFTGDKKSQLVPEQSS